MEDFDLNFFDHHKIYKQPFVHREMEKLGTEDFNADMESVADKISSTPALKSPHILVTGGAGYLGSILTPLLLKKNYRVHVLDRFYFGRSGLHEVEDYPHLKVTDVDISHHENIPHLFKDVQTVVHLASISNDPSGDLDPNLTIQTNFLATLSLARRAKEEGVKQFIFISSCSVYGANEDKFLGEDSEVGPVTLYALSKLQCEKELIPLADENFSVTILRFSTLFGYSPRMRFDLAVNAMVKRALQGQPILVNGDGKQYRPFLHIKDAARAILHIIESDSAIVNRGIFNVGNETLNFMIKDLAQHIQLHLSKARIERIESNNDRRSYRVLFHRFEKTCNFKTQYLIEDGVREIQEAYQKGLLQDMDHPRYYNVEVMKKIIREPALSYSLALAPRWIIEEPIVYQSNQGK